MVEHRLQYRSPFTMKTVKSPIKQLKIDRVLKADHRFNRTLIETKNQNNLNTKLSKLPYIGSQDIEY